MDTRVVEKELDPRHLESKEDKELFIAFLYQNANTPLFLKSKIYPFSTQDNSTINIRFKTPIVRLKNPVYGIIETPALYVGNPQQHCVNRTWVCNIGSLFKLSENTIETQIYTQPLIIKIIIQEVKENSKTTTHSSHINIPHLNVQEPVYYSFIDETNQRLLQITAIIMDRKPGEKLSSVIDKDRQDLKILTLKQRALLTFKIVQAYKLQVANLGVIHFDINPKNIMVEFNAEHLPNVNLIDYEFCQTKAELDQKRRSGSIGYTAPEVYCEQTIIDEKIDIYSLAVTLIEIWGGTIPNINHMNISHHKLILDNFDFQNLFFAITGIPEKVKTDLQKLFKKMIMWDPMQRPLYDEIEAQLQVIFTTNQIFSENDDAVLDETEVISSARLTNTSTSLFKRKSINDANLDLTTDHKRKNSKN